MTGGARGIIAAADHIEARIVEAEKLRAALEEIKRLHAPSVACRGCCSTQCPGDCDWSDAYNGELLTVCGHCCIDIGEHRQNDECLTDHEHGVEYGDQVAACSTAEIIARAGL